MTGQKAVLSVIGLVFLWVLGWYHETAMEVVSVWWRSESYAHGLLVLPIFGWLVWRERGRLSGLAPEPSGLMVVPVLIAGFGWFLGELGNVASVSHMALVMMLIFSLFGILGKSSGRALVFPILFLMFGIPTGEFLLPIMMKYTAMFTVSALRLSGVPVYQEGLHFVLPNGRWSVIEACSGFRYLIASVMVGTLYAYLSFRSFRRRLVFSLVAVIVPVVANWLRAYLIVMLGYLSNNEIATGVDHLIYGWVFFGMVILLMFWMGARWREDLDGEASPAAVAGGGLDVNWSRLARRAAPLAGAVALWPLVSSFFFQIPPDAGSAQFSPPEAIAPWRKVDSGQSPEFRPRFKGYQTLSFENYANDRGQLSLYVAVYSNQSPGRELVQAGNVLLAVENEYWVKPDEGDGPDSSRGAWHRSVLNSQGARAVVWSGYWIDGRLVTSDYAAKALLTLARLKGKSDRSAYVAVWAQAQDVAAAEQTLADFAATLQPAVIEQLGRLDAAQ